MKEIKKQEKIQLKQKFLNYGRISSQELSRRHSSNRAFEKGSHVRILLTDAEKCFAKSYEKIFSNEIFTIHRVDFKIPISYWLSDLKNRPIRGVFYHRELKQIELPEQYYVEKIVKSRKNPITNKQEFLVRWLGYSEEFDSWVDAVHKL